MKKKNIEKVFQEKLQDFSQIPEEHIWERISTSLDQKRAKRSILPVWWRIAGAAALVIAALFFFLPEGELPASEEIITETSPETPEAVIPGNDAPVQKSGLEENSVASEEETGELSPEVKIDPGNDFIKPKSGLAGIQNMKDGSEQRAHGEAEKDFSELDKAIKKDRQSDDIADDPSRSTEIAAIPLTEGDKAQRNSGAPEINNRELTVGEDKKSLEDQMVSEQIEEAEKRSILDVLAEREEDVEEERPNDRWEVGPRVAPVYFSSLAQGSPIHSSFRDNSKSGNVNMSYGVAVTYEISKKVKLRSGLHKVDFGYDTQDVSFSSSLTANTNGIINNIDYSLSSRNLVVRSNANSEKIISATAQDVAAPDASLNGKMIQEFGYLEVPLEMTYEVLDRRIGVNLVGGLSSLFLLDNSVVLEANGNITEMGEANNINALNFSTNFGVGIFYRINDNIQLNLEPMFKYQLNTFSDSSGNFQPFSMGVYSGLNFRF